MSAPGYESYRESGVRHIGDLPTHWSLVALKRVATFTYGDALAADVRGEGDIKVFGSNGPVGTHSAPNTSAPVVFVGRKGSCGALTWSDAAGFAIDTVYYVDPSCCRADLRWLYWTLHTLGLEHSSQDTGVPGLSREVAHSSPVPLPPPSEQAAIAAFLDRETGKIDALVEAQTRLIELLKEKRQAVISHAVTKGLDPAAPMKDSGVEWLGQVPAHWEVVKVVRHFRAAKGRDAALLTKEYCSENAGTFPVYSGQTENNGIMGYLDRFEFDAGLEGYLLATTVGAKAMTVSHISGKFNLSQNCMIIRPINEAVLPRFYYYHFQPTFSFHRALIPDHMQASFRMEDLYGFFVALPSLEEQYEISAHLDESLTQFRNLEAEAVAAIALLQERRAALISAAVTGKIDVRYLAPKQAEAA